MYEKWESGFFVILRKMLNIFFIVPVNLEKLWQTSRERDACKQSWSIRDKLMNLSKVGLSMESSIAEFFIFSSAFAKLFYLWRRWCNGLCLQVPCRSCYSCPLAHKRFDNCRFFCFLLLFLCAFIRWAAAIDTCDQYRVSNVLHILIFSS